MIFLLYSLVWNIALIIWARYKVKLPAKQHIPLGGCLAGCIRRVQWKGNAIHRIMTCIGKDLEAHPVPTHHWEQGCHSLDQASSGPIQPDLDCLWAWGIHSFSGQLDNFFGQTEPFLCHQCHVIRTLHRVCFCFPCLWLLERYQGLPKKFGSLWVS